MIPNRIVPAFDPSTPTYGVAKLSRLTAPKNWPSQKDAAPGETEEAKTNKEKISNMRRLRIKGKLGEKRSNDLMHSCTHHCCWAVYVKLQPRQHRSIGQTSPRDRHSRTCGENKGNRGRAVYASSHKTRKKLMPTPAWKTKQPSHLKGS